MQVKDGNHELIIIKAINAEGNSLDPSVILKGKCQDLEWARKKQSL
jgi:hypothetical protein